MNLPNVDRLIVEQEKIVDYLLNVAHPDNGGKAAFFLGLGFSLDNWAALAEVLRKAAQNHPVSKRLASPHGVKYVVDNRIEAPGGKTPFVRTVWIVDVGREAPRLVTAYPHEQ